jgi:AraC-like DNA-binding protein
VQGGAGHFRCSGAGYRAPRGAVTVLHPGEGHDGWVGPEEGLRYVVASLPESAPGKIFGFAGTPFFPGRVISDRLVAERLGAAYRLLATGEDDLRVESVAVQALGRLFRGHSRCRVDGQRSPVVEVVRRYLDSRFASRVTLGDLAARAETHPAALLRRFRAETGLAPYEYVVSRRIEEARRLLAAGLPPAEVSVLAGFADQSHLNRHFRRIVGVTPGRFARSLGVTIVQDIRASARR